MMILCELLLSIAKAANYFLFIFVIFRKELKTKMRLESYLFFMFSCLSFLLCFIKMDPFENYLVAGVFLGFFICAGIFELKILDFARYFVITHFSLALYYNAAEGLLLYFTGINKIFCQIIYYFFAFLLLLLMLVFRKRIRVDAFNIDKKISVPTILLLLFYTASYSFFIFATEEYLIEVIPEDIIPVAVTFSCLGSLVFVLILYILVFIANRENEVKIKYKLAEQYNMQQREYFEEISVKDRESRKLIHDRNAELVAIKGLFDKKEYDKLENYLSQLERNIKIAKSRNYESGNEIVNVIVNYYLNRLDKTTVISFKGHINEDVPVERLDLCVIVSNVLRNAVEELEQICGEKHILFEIFQTEDELTIREINSCRENNKKTGDHFGIGVSIIEDCVKKYGGVIEWNKNTAYFEEYILIPLKKI